MDSLSKEEQAFRNETKTWVMQEIAPRARQIDRDDRVPEEIFRRLHPYLMLTAPEKYGGGGKAEMFACLAVEQIGYVCPALVPYIEVGQLFCRAIEIAGSEEQKQRYLGRLAAGELGAYALTDRTPGSDPVAMETEAELANGRYRICGGKRHITFFERASMMVLFARTKGERGASAIGAYLFDAPFDGIRVERRSEWTGMRGHQAWDLHIEGAHATAPLGEPGSGLHTALNVLNHTRISLACGHVGLAQAAIDLAVRFAKDRRIGGKPLWQQQAIAFGIVDAQIRVDGARLLAYRAARMAERHERCRAEASMAKCAAAEALLDAVSLCNRTLGGYGGHLDYPAERHLRDAFSWVAAQGTFEVQRLTAARELFSAD